MERKAHQEKEKEKQLLTSEDTIAFYIALVHEWVWLRLNDGRTKFDKIMGQDESFYELQFMPRLQKATNTTIIMDKRIVEAIQRMLSKIDYLRVFQKNIKICSTDRIILIAEQLAFKKFITKSMLMNIKELANPDKSVEACLIKLCKSLEQGRVDTDDTQQLMQAWENHFDSFTLKTVWQKCILPNVAIFDRQLLAKVYKFYKQVIIKIKEEQVVIQIQRIFDPMTINKSTLFKKVILESGQQQIDQEVFESELNQIYQHIRKIIKDANLPIEPKFQLFGSARNGFSLPGSDVDITIFCQQKDEIGVSMSFILSTLAEHFSGMPKSYIKSYRFIPQAQVPVLKLQINSKTISNADIVLNNAHGVQNSKFFFQYSQIQPVRNFVLLIKKWAKSFELIDSKKFSSYAILYMSLYFLMQTEKINKATRQFYTVAANAYSRRGNRLKQEVQKAKVKSNIILKQKIDLYESFVDFLKYFSREGCFQKHNKTLCLLNQSVQPEDLQHLSCTVKHEQIWNQNSLINIHDPFDNSNTGKFRIERSEQFFTAIEQTLQILKANDIEKMIEIFERQAYDTHF